MTMTLGDLVMRNARLSPNETAIVFEGARFTHAQHAERACRLANALLDAGVLHQDRVAIVAQNCSQYLEVYSACEIAGFIAVGVNYRLSPAEQQAILVDCTPAAVVYEMQYADRLDAFRRALPASTRFVAIGEDYESRLTAASPSLPAVRSREDDTAFLIYTSGTTGKPKGVMLGHAGQLEQARQISAVAAAVPTDKLLVVMPLYHIGAKTKQLAYAYAGAGIVLHRAFVPAEVVKAIAAERVTATHLAPVMVQSLLDEPSLATHDRSTLHTIHYASAPMPVPLLRRAIDAFGRIFIQFYGMTENGLGSVLHKHQHRPDGTPDEVRRLASAGQPYPGCTVEVRRDDGSLCDLGEVGEVVTRSAAVMQGYWNNHAATLAVLRDGAVMTGDMGYFDEEGYLYIADRKKDMIISGGENIYSREVEDALMSHASVAEAAVIGVPDPKWGEAVQAFVCLRDGHMASEASLIDHVKSSLASYKKPRAITFVTALPRLSSTGKVDKKALRAPFWKDQDRQVS